jgi:condensin complex subunit 1
MKGNLLNFVILHIQNYSFPAVILKINPPLVELLESDAPAYENIDMLNAVKMSVYLLCQFIEIFEGEVSKPSVVAPTGRVSGVCPMVACFVWLPCLQGRKKTAQRQAMAELAGLDWDEEREKAVRSLLQLVQLPLNKLWNPPIVEEQFVKLVTRK